jgi:hypothetical protein
MCFRKPQRRGCFHFSMIGCHDYNCLSMSTMRWCSSIQLKTMWIWLWASYRDLTTQQSSASICTKAQWLQSDARKWIWGRSYRALLVRRSSFQSPTWGCQFALGQCAWFIYNRIWIVLQQGLAGWQGRLINIGVRRELVKTVLCALPTYLLTATKPPKRVL